MHCRGDDVGIAVVARLSFSWSMKTVLVDILNFSMGSLLWLVMLHILVFFAVASGLMLLKTVGMLY